MYFETMWIMFTTNSENNIISKYYTHSMTYFPCPCNSGILKVGILKLHTFFLLIFYFLKDIKPGFYIYILFQLEHDNDYINSTKNSSST